MPNIREYQQQVDPNYVQQQATLNPVQTTNYTGQDLDAISKGTSNLGDSLIRYGQAQNYYDEQAAAYQQAQQDKLDHFNANLYAENAKSNVQLQMFNYANDLKKTQTGAADKYADKVLQTYKDTVDDTVNQISDPLTRQITAQKLHSIRNDIVEPAIIWQTKQLASNQVATYQSTIANNASYDAQTGGASYEQSMATARQQVNMLPVSPAEKEKVYQSTSLQSRTAIAQNMLLTNPQQLNNVLGYTFGVNSLNGGKYADVAAESNRQGVDPAKVVALMQSESQGATTAQNPNSSAYGRLQITDGTWKEYGGTEANRSDPEAQNRIGVKIVGDTQNMLQAGLGRDPTLGEMKAGIMFRNNAATIIQSNPNTPIENIIGPKSAQANNLTGKTTGEVMQNLDKIMDKAISQVSTTDVPKWVQNMSTKERMSWQSKTQEQLNKQNETNNALFDQTRKSHESEAINGVNPTTQLSPMQFNARFAKEGPEVAQAQYNAYKYNLDVGAITSKIANTTQATDEQTIASYKPRADSLQFAQDQQAYNKLVTAVSNKRTAIHNDPANYYTQNNTDIRDAYNAFQNTPFNAMNPDPNYATARDNYFAKQIGAQTKYGIAVPSLLNKTDEANEIAKLNSAKPQDKAAAINELGQKYGQYYPNVMQQLQANKGFPMDASAMLITNKDPGTQLKIAANSGMSLATKVSTLLPDAKINNIKQFVDSDTLVSQFKNSIPPSANDLRSFQGIHDAIAKLAVDNATIAGNDKVSPSDVKLAAQQVLAKYNFVTNKSHSDLHALTLGVFGNNTSTVRIPTKYNSTAVAASLDKTLQGLNSNNVYLSPENKSKLSINPYSGNRANYNDLSQIKNRGFWVTNENEDGARLWYRDDNNQSYPVLDNNKKQIEKSFIGAGL